MLGKVFQSISLKVWPKSGHYSCILVVMDKFSKYAQILALVHPFTAQSVAQAYMHIYISFTDDLTKSIVIDREQIFTSHLCQELF
jgi:hypothetical protein